jgi:hypothetical protein
MTAPNPVATPSRRHRAPTVTRRAILATPLAALGVTALVLWASDPFAGTIPTIAETPATASLTSQDLSSQLTLNATLGYTGSHAISYQARPEAGRAREDRQKGADVMGSLLVRYEAGA